MDTRAGPLGGVAETDAVADADALGRGLALTEGLALAATGRADAVDPSGLGAREQAANASSATPHHRLRARITLEAYTEP